MKFGRYEILQELGKGSMGIVYKAHDPEIDRMVALKVMRKEQVSSEDAVLRFLKEARAIGRLSHPNIVMVYDVGQDHGTVYIAMELIEGRSLGDIMKTERLELEDVVNICSQVAVALDYAHEQGIVHRDIKPANIMLTKDRTVKITDFGIAHMDDSSFAQQTQAGEILGTPVYMSPEQVMGKKVDGRSDLYSLGAIIYELATGEKPFNEPSMVALFNAIVNKEPEAPTVADTSLTKSVSTPLSDLIMKSLAKDPDKRFQRGRDLAQALQRCLDSSLKRGNGKARPYVVRGFPLILSVILVLSVSIGIYLLYYSKKAPVSPSVGSKATTHPGPKKVHERFAVLHVTSRPPNALVFVNGKFKGRSPLQVDVPLGKNDIRVTMAGYFDWEAQLNVDKEGNIPLYARLLPISNPKQGK